MGCYNISLNYSSRKQKPNPVPAEFASLDKLYVKLPKSAEV